MKLSNTHRKILLLLPTSKEGAITTNEVAAAAHIPQGSAGARLSELAGNNHAQKVTAPRGPGGATRWWRKAAAPAEGGFTAVGLLVALACLALLMVGAVLMHRVDGQIPPGAWFLMGFGAVMACTTAAGLGRGRKSEAPQTFAGPVPLALSRANPQRDRQEGVADHHVYVAPLPLLLETARLAGPRIRKAGGVPVAPLDSGPARKVPVRGSVRGDLMIVLAVLGALAWCGCDDPPPALPDLGPVDIGSAFAVTKCEMLSMEIDKADGPGPSARAAGIAQTCWLRLIDYRLRRLVPLDDPGPPPPPPAEAPDTMPRPNAVRKTPLSEPGGGPYVVPNSPGGTGFGGGPDVGKIPPYVAPNNSDDNDSNGGKK